MCYLWIQVAVAGNDSMREAHQATYLPPQRRAMEEVVIAGMSGKLPESENLQEFWANLIGGVDMVTDDDRRWKAGECPLGIRQQDRLRVSPKMLLETVNSL